MRRHDIDINRVLKLVMVLFGSCLMGRFISKIVGLFMGLPSSLILAECTMKFIEKLVWNSQVKHRSIGFMYVDDVLLLVTDHDIEEVLCIYFHFNT